MLAGFAVVVAVPVGAAVTMTQPAQAVDTPTVQARLLAAAPTPMVSVVDSAAPTPAGWTAADGTPRTGLVQADAGLAAGSTIEIPVDATGMPAGPQLHREDPRLTAFLAALATLLACWGLLGVNAVVWRLRLTAIDLRNWADAWARVEPAWSGRDRTP
jgi:hypothetical protein